MPEHRRRITGAVIALAVFIYWALAHTGLCFSQARYLSDRELVVAALSSRPVHGMLPGTEDPAVFAARHPDCCKLDRSPRTRAWWDVIAGFNVSEVAIVYPLRDGYLRGATSYSESVSVSACGRPLKSRLGWGS